MTKILSSNRVFDLISLIIFTTQPYHLLKR